MGLAGLDVTISRSGSKYRLLRRVAWGPWTRETSLAGAGRSGIHLPPALQWLSRGSDDVEGPERSMALR
jgi:hypothetical protein